MTTTTENSDHIPGVSKMVAEMREMRAKATQGVWKQGPAHNADTVNSALGRRLLEGHCRPDDAGNAAFVVFAANNILAWADEMERLEIANTPRDHDLQDIEIYQPVEGGRWCYRDKDGDTGMFGTWEAAYEAAAGHARVRELHEELERLRAENARLRATVGAGDTAITQLNQAYDAAYDTGWMECASRAIEICRRREGVSELPLTIRREAAKCADSIELWCVTDCDKWKEQADGE